MKIPIKGYEGLYEVDIGGSVYSLRQNKKLKPFFNGNGYLKVSLFNSNGKRKKFYIHRLVAEAFLENPLNKPIVNHEDNNRQNNSVSNLKWVTQSENIIHSVKAGRHVCNLPNVKRKAVV